MLSPSASKTILRCFLAGIIPGLSAVSQASELSLVHGLYRKSKVDDGLSTSEMALGARYAQQFSRNMFWFAGGGVSIKSYSSAGDLTPDSTNDLSVSGGLRMYFDQISQTLTPYASAQGSFESTSSASQAGANSITEVKESGLFYGASVGLRINLSKMFFLDLESPLFRSALSAERKITSKTQAGNAQTETSSKTTRQELYMDTTGSFQDLIISIGMRI